MDKSRLPGSNVRLATIPRRRWSLLSSLVADQQRRLVGRTDGRAIKRPPATNTGRRLYQLQLALAATLALKLRKLSRPLGLVYARRRLGRRRMIDGAIPAPIGRRRQYASAMLRYVTDWCCRQAIDVLLPTA